MAQGSPIAAAAGSPRPGGDAVTTRLVRPLRILFALLRGLQKGGLVLTLPDGSRHAFTGREAGPQAEMIIHNLRMIRRTLFGGNIGFAESYMDGDWETPNLAALLQLLVVNDT